MKLYFWLCFLKGLLDDLFYNFGDIGDSTVLIIRVCQYMKQEIKFRTYTYPHHSRHGLNDVPSWLFLHYFHARCVVCTGIIRFPEPRLTGYTKWNWGWLHRKRSLCCTSYPFTHDSHWQPPQPTRFICHYRTLKTSFVRMFRFLYQRSSKHSHNILVEVSSFPH